ncbi:response regulator transcription factor [Aeromicrobium stalagmiti]|uniref:response regulator transcription factor n=1 Tax=Aeromicrobium stalagmiti TaxID=2738988 RepID=UPI0015680360|nr:response regulator transcription factor [Aeromicrobium stalagmiti]NRQ48815.1 response regulator transcription factor [Aeromicrobium stalagmiti]
MTLGDLPHVLVVEDDLAVRDVLRRYLEQESYDVTVAADGPAGLAAARDLEPDLIVLDVMLPGMSGLEICEHLRVEDGSSVPIIMLTALGETDDRIAGLTSGADDYVTKPFSAKEVTLRVGSVLRRSLVPAGPRPVAGLLTDGDLTLNPVSRQALQDGAPLPLTTREFDLLHFLLRHPHQVFSREDLLQQVWGWEYGDHSTVTVHVKRLRRKVEPVPAEPTRLVTVYGLGYRWDPTP